MRKKTYIKAGIERYSNCIFCAIILTLHLKFKYEIYKKDFVKILKNLLNF